MVYIISESEILVGNKRRLPYEPYHKEHVIEHQQSDIEISFAMHSHSLWPNGHIPPPIHLFFNPPLILKSWNLFRIEQLKTTWKDKVEKHEFHILINDHIR